MAEQELTRIKLSFEHNVKQKDVDVIGDLARELDNLNKIKLNDGLATNLKALGDSLKSFKGVSINKNLGEGIGGLIDAANRIDGVRDITPYAKNLGEAFKLFKDATKPFETDKSAKIGLHLGRSITGLVDAANKITHVRDIKPHAENMVQGFDILANSTAQFSGVNANIGVNLGKSITGIVGAINSIEQVKDISMQADNLRTGFHVLGYVSREFNRFEGRIPVTLGRGITGIIEAINSIEEVKNISPYTEILKTNFRDIALVMEEFDGLQGADYSGISRMITAISNVSKVKPIGKEVVNNAELLAQAIQILGNNVSVDTPKMEAMAKVAKELGINFKYASKETKGFGKSLNLLNFELVIRNVQRLTRSVWGFIKTGYDAVAAFGEVENTISFFSQSLGDQSEKMASQIQQFADAGVINFAEFGGQVAKLNQIYRGYGISAEEAGKMALNMTQLAYDASFALGENGKDIALWNQRTLAVATGQTRSGYYFGVDTNVKTLTESFDEMSSQSDKATRSIAAYNTMMGNTTAIQNQMAREQLNTYVQLDALQNKWNQFKQSIGQNLLPAFQWIIKWGMVAINVVAMLTDALSRLFGGSGFELIRYEDMIENIDTGVGGVADNADNLADGMASANKQAKELKKTITGIDQVFTINDRKPSDTGGLGDIGGSGALGAVDGYSWDGVFQESADLMKRMEEHAEKVYGWITASVPYAVAMASAFAAWKLSKSLMDGLKWISGLKNIAGGLGLEKITAIPGLALFLDDIRKFKNAVQDIMENGITFDNVAAMLSSFTGMVGDALLIFGNFKMAGVLKVAQGLVDIGRALKLMYEDGPNWDNVSIFIDGLSTLGIGVGLVLGNWEVVGWSMAFKGIFNLIKEIADNWEQVKKLDFSGLDKEVLITSAIMAVAGIVVAFAKFKDKTASSIPSMETTPSVLGKVSDATGGVSTKLVDMAKNLGMGILIMAEVAAAALIFVGAIWLVGEGLQKIQKAWTPIIENGDNVVLGLTLGTALLGLVGVATYGLGTIAIGNVTVPLAIAAGTGMLLLLAGATKLFIASLTSVAKQLVEKLSPELAKLNKQMPTLNTGMKNYTNFMFTFAGQFVIYSGSSAVSGIAATISTVIGWFTKDPIKKMADDVKKNGKQLENLNKEFAITNPRINKANDYMNDYERLLKQLKTTSDRASEIGSPTSVANDFKGFSKALKDAFKDLDSVKTNNVSKIMSALNSLDLNKFRGIGTSIVKAMELGINNYNFNLNKATNNIKGKLGFSSNYLGTNIARGVQNGINNFYPNTKTFTNRLKRGMQVSFTIKSPSRWARDYVGAFIGEGVEVGINEYDPDFNPFRNNVRDGLEGMSDELMVEPRFEMPTFDTRALNNDMQSMTKDLSAEVQSRFEYTNDGTEKAIYGMTSAMIDKFETLIQAVEDGKEITIDGEKIGEVSDKYIKNKAVRMNTVFGR